MTTQISSSRNPVLTFGVVADVQYADEDDVRNHDKTRTRHYRNSVKRLENAINYWRQANPRLNFILQLGDYIDGICSRKGSELSLQTALRPFTSYGKPVYHVLGNHELYNFSREDLTRTELFSAGRMECQSPDGCFYYSFQPHPALKIIVLDCFDVSLLGYSTESEVYQQAYKIITSKNSNDDLNSCLGLSVEAQRFVKWNGSVSSIQMDWLDTQLKHAELHRQNVIVVGHLPLISSACDPCNLCWNAKDVVEVIHKHRCVVSYMCGHDHDGGDAVDNHGVLHVTMPGLIEREPGHEAFSTAILYPDRLDIEGRGIAGSFSAKLRYPISMASSKFLVNVLDAGVHTKI